MAEVYLRNDVAARFSADPLRTAWAMKGEVVRSVAGRETLRVELSGNTYYLKRHHGVGIGEVLKNWLIGKQPILGARNEFEACRHLQRAGVVAPTVAAFGESVGAPFQRSSFILCDALQDYEDLEQWTIDWPAHPPDLREKRRLVMAVAAFARRFHQSGVVHRDFYLCHLLKSRDPQITSLAVLDLHRALIFPSIPERWRLRDLAALLYSTFDLPISQLSWLRFVRVYTGRPLQEVFAEDGVFWLKVHARALDLYRKGTRKGLTRGSFEP